MLGSFTDFVPKHVKQYAKLADIMSSAIAEYFSEVKSGKFPTEAQSFTMDESILAGIDK
jgi:3-methyl-2-oxobutanoate hydroxymethyltransferase